MMLFGPIGQPPNKKKPGETDSQYQAVGQGIDGASLAEAGRRPNGQVLFGFLPGFTICAGSLWSHFRSTPVRVVGYSEKATRGKFKSFLSS
jgi:hypothetical protein